MSEIAGRLAAQAGAYFLEKPLGRPRPAARRAWPGVAPGRVLVIGGGIVGYNAAVIAIGLGANVTILERSLDRMRHLDEILSGRVSLVMSSTLQIEESIRDADVVIGAVLIPGAKAPKLISAADARRDEGRRGVLRRGDRPGRLRRDVEADHAHRPGLRRRRRHPLLRREHARRGSDHVDEGADERDAARTSRRSRATGSAKRSPSTRDSHRA